MSGITTEPSSPPSVDELPQLIYTLSAFDHADWLTYEAHLRQGPAPAPQGALVWGVWMPLLTLAVLLTAGLLWGGFVIPNRNLRPPAFVAACLSGLGLWWLARRPALRSVWAQLRQEKLTEQARDQAQVLVDQDAIDPRRIHWLVADTEGYTEVTELRCCRRQGTEEYEYREVRWPWFLVKDVMLGPRHVFLVYGLDKATIIPLRAFPDQAAVDHFLQRVRSLVAAAARAPVGSITVAPAHPEGIQDNGLRPLPPGSQVDSVALGDIGRRP